MIGMTQSKTYHRTLAWALVLLFTAVSVTLNGLHAVMQWDGKRGEAFGAVLLAVMAPVSLLMATHLLVGLIQDWTHRRKWLARLRGTVAAVFAVIGAIAFIMSFAALRDMAERYGMAGGLSWMTPVIIDSVILAGTLAVVIAEAEMRLDREEAAAAEAVIADQSAEHSANADRVFAEQLTATEQSAEQRSPITEMEPSIAFGEHADSPNGEVSAGVQRSATGGAVFDERSPNAERVEATAFGEHSGTDDHPVDQRSGITDQVFAEQPMVAEQPTEQAMAVGERSAIAEQVHAEANSKADIETVGRVLGLLDEGWSRRDIGAEVGMSRSTVTSLAKAAEKAAARHPALALVGSD
ncbi:DUF2637 domain-containing protein [Gordonia hydrophobica]|uniref:DUF2637 domain-containing protein n=1 Tax=Gordonia hydrophobica TaxID=40516 RepID=A0ABZ2TXD3_9ACTN|nr:DUF2637 domain-containing protein [Gordonia hydrophobica]MBM7366347.1 hypothetical protein [Gordonia hydrophobica]